MKRSNRKGEASGLMGLMLALALFTWFISWPLMAEYYKSKCNFYQQVMINAKIAEWEVTRHGAATFEIKRVYLEGLEQE